MSHYPLRQLKKELPTCEKVILNANGSLEIIGLDLKSFKAFRVHAPCESIIDGVINVESFEMLYKLTQDKAVKEVQLLLEVENGRMLMRPDARLKGKKGYATVSAEYRFATFEDPHNSAKLLDVVEATMPDESATMPDESATMPDESATMPDSGPEPEKESVPEVKLHVPIQSVTIPSAVLKSVLPRSNHNSVTIAATSKGVFILGTQLSLGATDARFYISVPVSMLKEAIKAGKNVTVGILKKGTVWKAGGYHSRNPLRFYEIKNGTVNGLPFHEPTNFNEPYHPRGNRYHFTFYADGIAQRVTYTTEQFARWALEKREAAQPEKVWKMEACLDCLNQTEGHKRP